MRMLIVDDDRMICAGTARRIVSMQFPEVEAVECAYSGEEALEMLRLRRFDAMFTDICMAELDGLGLIESAKEINPNLICIIITAFDRFQYAQQAIRLGVKDFVVKPLSQQSMRKHVRAVIDKYLGMTAQKESRLELEICAQILSGERDVAECFSLCGFPAPDGDVCMVAWEDLPDGTQWEELSGEWIWQPRDHRFLLAKWGPQSRQRIQRAAVRLGIFVGVSMPGKNLKQLSEQATGALQFCWLRRSPTALFWTPQSAVSISNLRQRLLTELRAMNAGGVEQLLNGFLENLPENRYRAAGLLVETVQNELTEMQAALGMETRAPLELRPGLGGPQAVHLLAQEIARLEQLSSNPDRFHPIAYAKRYAREHLYESIDMAVVANQLNLSYAYFSRIFREQAGMTFTKYLLELRMQEICRLLLEGEKLVDIAPKFGYQNAANLTRSFTREVGMSPSKWLESHAGSSSGETGQ
ncbi:MAG: helix-turn-helix domain-containing protein [Candidatus Faecivicinus sp.]